MGSADKGIVYTRAVVGKMLEGGVEGMIHSPAYDFWKSTVISWCRVSCCSTVNAMGPTESSPQGPRREGRLVCDSFQLEY